MAGNSKQRQRLSDRPPGGAHQQYSQCSGKGDCTSSMPREEGDERRHRPVDERDAPSASGDEDQGTTGICVMWNKGGGFGFIARDGKDDIFVHKSGLGPIEDLREGDEVKYTIGEGRNGPCAKITELLGRDREVPEPTGRSRRMHKRRASVYDKESGILVQWNAERGFGIIERGDESTVLLHAAELRGISSVEVGDEILFEAVDGRGGKPKAKNVGIVSRRVKDRKGRDKGPKGKWDSNPGRRKRSPTPSSSDSSSSSKKQKYKKQKKDKKGKKGKKARMD
eukprot:gene19037-biopygen8432